MKRRPKEKAKEMTAAVAAKEKVEEKVEAWMVSLAVIDEPESSFDAADLSCGFNSSDNDWFEEMDSLPDLQPVSDSDDSKMEENLPDNLDNMDSLPDLESVSDSEIDEKDLLENFGEEYIIPFTYPFPLNNPKACSKVFDNLDSPSKEFEYFSMKEEAYVTTYEASMLRETPGPLPIDVNLYNLGASHHMSGFHHRFVNFVKIPPKPITAADRRSFSAVEKGDIWVYLPNREEKAS
jgi:hypothetical protein